MPLKMLSIQNPKNTTDFDFGLQLPILVVAT